MLTNSVVRRFAVLMISFNSLLFKLVDLLLKQKEKEVVKEGFGAAPLDCLMTIKPMPFDLTG